MEKDQGQLPDNKGWVLYRIQIIITRVFPRKDWKSYSVFVVILCAFTGYTITLCALQSHFVQGVTLPANLNVKIEGNKNEHARFYRYPIVPTFREDTSEYKLKVIPASRLSGDDAPFLSAYEMDTATGNRLLHEKKLRVHTNQSLFHTNPNFLIFVIVLLTLVSICSGCMPVFAGYIYKLIDDYRLHRQQLLFAIACTFLVFGLLTFSYDISGIFKPERIIDQMNILVSDSNIITRSMFANFMLITPIATLMFLVAPAADATPPDVPRTKAGIENAARNLESLNKLLYTSLQILSIAIVFAVLASNYLRSSIVAVFTVEGYDIFPVTNCYVFGFYLSLFLAIVYVPVYYFLKESLDSLKRTIVVLKNETKNHTLPDGEMDDKWEMSVLGTIKIDNTAMDNFKLVFIVLSPLLTSFLPADKITALIS